MRLTVLIKVAKDCNDCVFSAIEADRVNWCQFTCTCKNNKEAYAFKDIEINEKYIKEVK